MACHGTCGGEVSSSAGASAGASQEHRRGIGRSIGRSIAGAAPVAPPFLTIHMVPPFRPQMLWRSNSIHREKAQQTQWHTAHSASLSCPSRSMPSSPRATANRRSDTAGRVTPGLARCLARCQARCLARRPTPAARGTARRPAARKAQVSIRGRYRGQARPSSFFMSVSRCVTAGVITAFEARPQWCPALRPPW